MRKASSGIGISPYEAGDLNPAVNTVNGGSVTLTRAPNQLQTVVSALTAGQSYQVLLPAEPAIGDMVTVKIFGTPTAATATITVAGNGHDIDGGPVETLSDIDFQSGVYLYVGTVWLDISNSA